MAAIYSAVVGVMLRAVRRSSKGLVRDFNEIRYLKSSYTAASEFTRAAYARSSKIIAEELSEYKQGLEILYDGSRDARDPGQTFWFVSTIDSRTNFMSGLPYFATMVALFKNGEVIAAVVDAPVLRETYYTEKGFGSFSESSQSRYARMYVTKRENICAAVVDCTAGCAKVRDIVHGLAANHVVLRAMGSVILGFSYLCAGCYDAVVYSGISEHKASVGKLLIEGSKGSVSERNGLFVAGNFFV